MVLDLFGQESGSRLFPGSVVAFNSAGRFHGAAADDVSADQGDVVHRGIRIDA
jgi:hypothetical protein